MGHRKVKMPKAKETTRGFCARIVQEYRGVFRADRSVLYCLLCNCNVNGHTNWNVKQHMKTDKHLKAAAKSGKNVQTLLTEFEQPQPTNEFNADLCRTFLEANIPLKKVGHPSIVQFLEKYTNKTMPSESTIRQKYVPLLYDETIETLRDKAANKYIWASIDETTDSEQRLVVNFVFGLMEGVDENSPERGKCYLLNMAEVDSSCASNMAAFFNDSLSLLWPQGEFNFMRSV